MRVASRPRQGCHYVVGGSPCAGSTPWRERMEERGAPHKKKADKKVEVEDKDAEVSVRVLILNG